MGHSHSIKQYPGQMMAIAGIAAGLGALAAVLITPKNGKEMRQSIADKSKSAKQRNDKIMEAEKDMVKNMSSRAKTITRSARSGVKSTAQKIKGEAKETGNKASTAFQDTKKDSKDVTDEIRRNGEP